MCTTYVGAVVVSRLKQIGVKLVSYPKLIRLNPQWIHKTRGNCSVAITVQTGRKHISAVKNTVLSTVEGLAELRVDTTNPGVAFYLGKRIPAKLKAFSKKVVQDIATIKEAETLAEEIGAEVHKFKLGRGIIGALAAIGNTLEKDWTFELIAYRVRKNWGTKRKIDANSVEEMDAKTFPQTFDNLDRATGEIRITPHTPCPILYGIRGETPKALLKARELVRAFEPIERFVIYKTNQGTGEHLVSTKISLAKPYRSVAISGIVCRKPKIIAGGHVIFSLRDETGEIDCVAYEPTHQFREIVKKLVTGDEVRVYGGVKKKPGLPLTVNLEKLDILKLARVLQKINPSCPSCGKRMKSEGKNKGYSCKRCRLKASPSAAKFVEVPREIKTGMFEVPPRARRHLAQPLVRTNTRQEY